MHGLRLTCLLAGLAAVPACVPSWRPYDGVVGFEARALDRGVLAVRYVDHANVSWPRIRRKLEAGCADRLGTQEEDVALARLEQESGVTTADLSVAVTGAFASPTAEGPSGGTYTPSPPQTTTERVPTEVPLRILRGVCSPRQ